MKPIYYLEVTVYDYCDYRYYPILYTKNKTFIESLCQRLSNKYRKSEEYSFIVKELEVLDTPTRDQVKSELQFLSIEI